MVLRNAALSLFCVLGRPLLAGPGAPDLRLPGGVRPVKGRLELTLRPDREDYAGTATYELRLAKPTDLLWLNATGLRLGTAKVTAGHRTVIGQPVQGDDTVVGFRLPAPVGPGAARLVLHWEGRMDSTLSRGLYRVKEGDDWYAYTFFEPIDARRAFPCFDEPGFKIPWTLVLHVPAGQVAAANTRAVRQVPEPGGLTRVEFAESRPLPSYLVAWMVGPFDLVPAGTAGHHGTPLRFIVPKGRGPETAYAAKATPRLVGLLEDFFGMPYPYGKLDVAVVPRFWGTMEHPGLVALGQPLTLIKPEEETPEREQRYASIAVHELGHYWFGDVVTMAWWDDTWLNEGMTTWLDAKMTDAFEPAWRVGVARSQEIALAMTSDALPSAKRVRQPVDSRDRIENAFDNALTYFKGDALMTMAERWVGPDRFRALVRRYIQAHAWGNATSEDWLRAVARGAGGQARAMFQGFISQPGIPLVAARCIETPAGWELELTQRRFLAMGTPEPSRAWTIPVGIRAGRKGGPGTAWYAVLAGPTGRFPLPGGQRPDWLLLNAGGAGYYRVAYTPEQLADLRDVPLDTPEKLSLLGDARALGDTGALSYEASMALATEAAADPDRLVVAQSLALEGRVPFGLLAPEAQALEVRRIRALWGSRAEALGWAPRPGEDLETRRLRLLLVPFVALRDASPALAAEAVRRAEAWLEDRRGVDPDLAGPVLMVAAHASGRPFYDRLVAELGRTQAREDRAKLLAALGAFRDPEVLRAALDRILDPAFDVRESRGILFSALGDLQTKGLAWAWLKAHFESLASHSRSDELCWLIERLGPGLWDTVDRAELETTLRPKLAAVDGGPIALTRSLESYDVRRAQARRDLAAAQAFLAKAP